MAIGDSNKNSNSFGGGMGGDKTTESTDKPPDWNDTNSWVSFLKSLFVYFFLTLLIGLVGSGFVYLTTRGDELDTIFPTYPEFYSAPTYQITKPGASNMDGCNEVASGSFSVFEENFPYNLIKVMGNNKEELKALSLIDRMCNWFAKTVAGCFKSNRALLKGWLDNFSPSGGNPLANQTFQIFIAAPLTMVLSLFALVSGFWAAFGACVSADMKVTVWGGFLLYAWGLCIGLSMVIFARLIGTLVFLPMSQNWKEVSNIMACNVTGLVVVFGFFVCGSAYDTLDTDIANIMGVVYLALVAWTMWKYFSSQFF